PHAANYEIDGPEHQLFLGECPRRVRAIFGGATVLDSRRARLLHETGLLPQMYIPHDDVRVDMLEHTDHTTHCPFKGDASYWSLRAAGRVADNAAWAYREPRDKAGWLRDYIAFYWDSLDAWFDEDEEVRGH